MYYYPYYSGFKFNCRRSDTFHIRMATQSKIGQNRVQDSQDLFLKKNKKNKKAPIQTVLKMQSCPCGQQFDI